MAKISSEQIAVFVREKSIDRTLEEALRRVIAQKAVMDGIAGQRAANADETDKIYDDQQRLRENIKSLKGSPEEKPLLQRYTQRLNEQENRLEALKSASKQLDAQHVKEQEALKKVDRRAVVRYQAVRRLPLLHA